MCSLSQSTCRIFNSNPNLRHPPLHLAAPTPLTSFIPTPSHLQCLILCPESKIGFFPHTPKSATGMDNRESETGYDNHRSIENHERDFVIGEVASEAFGKFCNSKYGADEDSQSCESEC